MYLLIERYGDNSKATAFSDKEDAVKSFKRKLDELVTLDTPCIDFEEDEALAEQGLYACDYDNYGEKEKAIIVKAIENSKAKAIEVLNYCVNWSGEFTVLQVIEINNGDTIDL